MAPVLAPREEIQTLRERETEKRRNRERGGCREERETERKTETEKEDKRDFLKSKKHTKLS